MERQKIEIPYTLGYQVVVPETARINRGGKYPKSEKRLPGCQPVYECDCQRKMALVKGSCRGSPADGIWLLALYKVFPWLWIHFQWIILADWSQSWRSSNTSIEGRGLSAAMNGPHILRWAEDAVAWPRRGHKITRLRTWRTDAYLGGPKNEDADVLSTKLCQMIERKMWFKNL